MHKSDNVSLSLIQMKFNPMVMAMRMHLSFRHHCRYTHLTSFDCAICNPICVSMSKYYIYIYMHFAHHRSSCRLMCRCHLRTESNAIFANSKIRCHRKSLPFTVVVLLRHVHLTAKSVFATIFKRTV